ncbi:TonB-dependent receptor [Azospirillum sp. TSO22-1]|uniref:TonB-dependent receptor plug domain-containing protein n=1 Tax=Azospirillum sp. TSO22-1 TaxID=716789 RepID=UPI000D61062D|nr:TonB-dependent receptor [Azospirillum sp. TSO22-1]PWC32015.1 TonB-dependent receptor [Azospirillum sp. TSO22-1]
MQSAHRYIFPYTAASILALTVGAGAAAGDEASNVFHLGQINVSAQGSDSSTVGGSVLPQEEMWRFNRNSLDDALNLVPGVVSSNTGGSRNERTINVRGFDRFQVPLSIDGIRVYLPADNRLDFNRFLTPDVSEVQVAKGYVSVLDGPGGLGGAINLVTRKPGKAFEAEGRGGLSFDSNGALNGYTTFGAVGTRQEKFYLQATGAKTEQTHFRLSNDFTPTVIENGGNRDHSRHEDWRVNVKAGFTPNDTDEYSINFTKQSGSKEAPFHVTDPLSAQRYWQWPYWDIQSVYWLSNTKLGEASYAKVKVYYNTFENGLYSYDDPNFQRQTLAKAFRSYYDDKAYGGALELGTDLIPMNTLKTAFHYRRDDHAEWQDTYAPRRFTEPKQSTVEDTYSLAVENTFHATSVVDLVVGASYDWRVLHKAQDWDSTGTGRLIGYPLEDNQAFNWQAAANYRFSDTGKVYASLSSRTRFPTIFDRFSSRFGGATSNPGLRPEHAINAEIGVSEQVFGNTRLDAALFHSRVTDFIESVPIVFAGQRLTQSQNVGSGEFHGVEVGAVSRLTGALEVGGNYTLIQRNINNPGNPAFQATDVPIHKLFAYASWEALEGLTITPNVETASNRWTVTTNGATYYKTGAYVQGNLTVNYKVTKNAELAAGVRNLFDQNYALVDGFPEPGRTFFLNARVTF